MQSARVRGWRSCCWAALLLVAAFLVTAFPRVFAADPASVVSARVDQAEPAPPVIQFAKLCALDLQGKAHQVGTTEHCPAVVLVFLATECPISNSYLAELNVLAACCKKKRIEFYGVICDPAVTRAQCLQHSVEYRVRFPVLFDSSGGLRAQLKATHAPQAFVLRTDGTVLYQGRIDQRYAAVGKKRVKMDESEKYLAAAIKAAAVNETPAVTFTKPIGCHLEDPIEGKDDAEITYARDIAPIIQTHCVQCHRPNQTAPFSLLNYEDVAAHARQICESTQSGAMPPWRAARGFGHFRNERGMTDAEIELLVRWTDAGKSRGDLKDLPAPRRFTEGWQLGKPDLIIEMPEEFEIRASGDDVHRYFVMPIALHELRLVSSVEFLPGNPKVVHHGSFYLDNTGTGRKLDAADPEFGYSAFGDPGFRPAGTFRSWLPGVTQAPLPQGTGRYMPKACDLVLEIHYRPSGKPERDRSKIGIRFAPRETKQVVGEIQILNYSLDIPAGAARHREAVSYTLPVDATIFDAYPHMHLLGREVKATATRPDGSTEPLVWVKDWDFQWQEQYLYAEPLKLPKGTRIDIEWFFDNSAANPVNPTSPPRHVRWGGGSSDEMAIVHFQFSCDTRSDFELLLKDYEQFVAARRDLQRALISKAVAAQAP